MIYCIEHYPKDDVWRVEKMRSNQWGLNQVFSWFDDRYQEVAYEIYIDVNNPLEAIQKGRELILSSTKKFNDIIYQTSKSRFIICPECGDEIDRMKIQLYIIEDKNNQPQVQCESCHCNYLNKNQLIYNWRKDLGQL